MSKDTENTKLWKLFERRDLLENTRPTVKEAKKEIIERYNSELNSVNKEIDELLRD